MPINAYLNFDGNTREVVTFYAEAFRTEPPQLLTFGSVPAHPDHPLPPGTEDLIMHAQLIIDGSPLMFSDVFPGMPFNPGNNITLAYITRDEAALREIFHRLKEGGKIAMELQETSWSKCYGQVEDKFGILWQLSLEA